jgi:hypothetical protein
MTHEKTVLTCIVAGEFFVTTTGYSPIFKPTSLHLHPEVPNPECSGRYGT